MTAPAADVPRRPPRAASAEAATADAMAREAAVRRALEAELAQARQTAEAASTLAKDAAAAYARNALLLGGVSWRSAGPLGNQCGAPRLPSGAQAARVRIPLSQYKVQAAMEARYLQSALEDTLGRRVFLDSS